jgi:hypothetical protein
MTTERQRLANQRNARLSRGPKTAAGKARSRRNALTHGLSAKVLIAYDKNQRIDDFARHVAHDTAPDIACELSTGEYELRQVRLYQCSLLCAVDAEIAGGGALESGSTDATASMDETDVSDTLDKLLKSQRYERQAQAKLRRALRRKMERG